MIGGHSGGLPLWREMRWRELHRELFREIAPGQSFAQLTREVFTLLRQIDKQRRNR